MKKNLLHLNLLVEVLNKLISISDKMSIVPFLIGVAGGPCSGKSTVCQKIVEDLQSTAGVDQASRVTVIPMENFYKPKTTDQRDMALRGNYNLDHPDAFDEKLLFKTLQDLLKGQTVKVIDNE
jgi:uridine kinase